MTNTMIEYKVQVYANGTKSWYLNGKKLTEKDHKLKITVDP